MTKKCFVFLFFILIFVKLAHSQKGRGIQFKEKTKWEDIKKKASDEKKYIFVDCFATWCGPCKKMEKEIYSLESIGNKFNSDFVSIKLQMDKTPNDKNSVKSQYITAEYFKKEFSINAYPTLLFLSPEGKLLHKGVGFKDSLALLMLASDALNPSRQYSALTEKYKSGMMMDESEIRNFIIVARENGNWNYSRQVARKFKHDFLDDLSIDQICTLENLNFIESYQESISSEDNFFKLCFEYPQRVEELKPGLASSIINNVIEREEIYDKLQTLDSIKRGEPNWNEMRNSISSKYGEKYASKLIFPAQKKYAFQHKKWNEYVKLQDIENSRKNSIMRGDCNINESWDLNMAAWNTYLSCDDSTILRKALEWSNLSIKVGSCKIPNPTEQYYDTKARILYKLGNIIEAIENEEKAIDLGTQMARFSGGNKGAYEDDYRKVLHKMKKGESIVGLD